MPKKKPAATSKDKGNGGYQADSIQVLKGLEAVRRRPAMYIGSVSARGLHHLVYEVVDNSVDEALAGFATTIAVTIHADNAVTVVDNGRGIPVDIHKTEKKPGVEVALTVLHAGGKFDKSSYKVSGGLHGVGVSVVNALSEKLEVWVDRDGKRHHMAFERGDTKKKLEIVGKAKGTGTTVWFKPDTEIFTETRFDYATIANRLRELAFLNKALTITLKDERKGSTKEETFYYKGGLAEFVKWVIGNRRPLHPKPITFEATREDAEVEGAVQYDDQYSENTFTFVNNINTHEGGTHLTGFKSALTRTINEWAKQDGILKKEEFTLSGDDVREGLNCVLHVKVKAPQFEGQTKTKLGNSEVEGVVRTVVNDALGAFFDKNPSVARSIIAKAVSAARARDLRRAGRYGHVGRDRERGSRARGGAQSARAGPQEERPRCRHPAGQAGRLLADRSQAVRDLFGRGRLRRRLGENGTGPELSGDSAAARQDPQRPEGANRQDPLERGDPDDDHRDRHGRG